MGQPISSFSSQHAIEAMERAAAAPTGIRVFFKTKGEAFHFRMSCYHARRAARKQGMKMYPPGDPMFGKSPFDHLTMNLRETDDGRFCVEIVTARLDSYEFEEF